MMKYLASALESTVAGSKIFFYLSLFNALISAGGQCSVVKTVQRPAVKWKRFGRQ